MPEQMNLQQARIVDAVNSTIARGFKHPKRVGSLLFPVVPVTKHGGQVIEFGKESFRLYRTRRAPGADKVRVRFGYEGKPYGLENHDLEVPMPDEIQTDAPDNLPGQGLGQRATNLGMNSLTLELEVDQANLARDAVQYAAGNKLALAGTDVWSDPASTPIDDIKAARSAIRSGVGLYPNVAVFSAKAFESLTNHPDVVDRYKHTRAGVITAELIAALFQLDVVGIGGEVTADDAGAFSDVWGTDVVLSYSPQAPSGMEEPSYGYTYTLTGHPAVLQPYRENRSNSWIYPVDYHRAPQLAGADAGFLIQGAGD